MFYFLLISVIIIETIVLLFQKKTKKQSKITRVATEPTSWDKKYMAFHEAGHAVCSFYLPEREKLLKITIDPSSEAFGMIQTAVRPHYNETYISLTSTISTFLAGTLSEEIFLNTKTSSGYRDLATARQIATKMVIQFGMGKKQGLAVLENADGLYIGERITQEISEDIQDILINSEKTARFLLSEHKSEVLDLAHLLLKQKTLTTNEINSFFAKKDK